MVYAIVLEEQREKVYTIGPAPKTRLKEASDPEKEKKRRAPSVVVHTSSLHVMRDRKKRHSHHGRASVREQDVGTLSAGAMYMESPF